MSAVLLIVILLAVLVLYTATMFALAWFSIHPLRMPIYLTPTLLGLPEEPCEIEVEPGLKIRGWWVRHENPVAVAVFAHGYMANRCEWLPHILTLYPKRISCLLFDFRAHGRSSGHKTSLGWEERAEVREFVNWAKRNSPNVPVVLFGSSMGAAACAYALEENPRLAKAAVFDAPYADLWTAATNWWGFLCGKRWTWVFAPVIWFGTWIAHFDPRRANVRRAAQTFRHLPTLLMYGDRDSLVGRESALQVYEALQPESRIVWFPNCEHAQARLKHTQKYNRELLAFLEDNQLLEEQEAWKGNLTP